MHVYSLTSYYIVNDGKKIQITLFVYPGINNELIHISLHYEYK